MILADVSDFEAFYCFPWELMLGNDQDLARRPPTPGTMCWHGQQHSESSHQSQQLNFLISHPDQMLLLNRKCCRFCSPGSLHTTRHIISLYFNPHSLQFLLMLSIVPETALQPKHICCLRFARSRLMLSSLSPLNLQLLLAFFLNDICSSLLLLSWQFSPLLLCRHKYFSCSPMQTVKNVYLFR